VPLHADADRSSLRAVWIEAWRRHRARLPLAPLEAQLVELIALHPEYHAALDADPDAGERDWAPETGQSNPFLHLGLHAAVRDGIATDRPEGIRAVYHDLLARTATPHDAEHVLLDCLGETLWAAQRSGLPPDERAYLEKARQRSATR
jgi:hypothetical protein